MFPVSGFRLPVSDFRFQNFINPQLLLFRTYINNETKMKKTVTITGVVVILALLGLMVFLRFSSAKDKSEIEFAEVRKGTFEITVSSPGELIAENSIEIKGPDMVRQRNFRGTAIRITDMVPEGTIVRKGGYIATLDRTFYDNILKDEVTELNNLRADLEMKILDSAVVLNTLRDEIRNQTFIAQEAAVIVDQSVFEPPTVQRKAVLDLDKAERQLSWQNRLYYLKKAQVLADVRSKKQLYNLQLRKVTDLEEALKEFTVRAPADGLVLYSRDRLGVKIKQGSTIHPFNPVVASLPDLSTLVSKAYVSEIDVNKVKSGQQVQVNIEAFRDKVFSGRVVSVANIGEQLRNSDSKVFEVLVKLDFSDPALRPTMTTGNTINARTFDNVIYIPLESLHTGSDNIPYVYMKNGFRQIVLPGESNDRYVIIEKGLEEGSSVYVTIPEKRDKFTLAGNVLIPVIRERERERAAAGMSSVPEKSIAGSSEHQSAARSRVYNSLIP